ncbi:EF hand [Pseudoxanthomonas wuyuanensis]|uniref:EF hand n=2 Tax=Pseudoxanthomonas wuyuanensis TaxID=1073196 RepID=A0A286DG95_9GAMM|nr:EF hand [Pseudoxanthomonas wuyuanensis]
MTRKTLLMMAVLTALGAGSAIAATTPDTAGKRAERIKLDANGDGFIDRAEAAAHPRLAAMFDELDKNKDGKLSADERPQRDGRWGHKGHRGHDGHAGMRGPDFTRGNLDTDKDGRISRAEAAADEKFAGRFDAMDLNKDGFVDRADHEARAKQRHDQWFAAADTDKDGKLSRAEFDAAHGKRRDEARQRMQAGAAERFAAMDSNKDGKISRDEAKGSPRLAERFEQLDANKDGFLGKEELQKRMQR